MYQLINYHSGGSDMNEVNEKQSKVGLPEFESGFLAPKAKRMDQATPQAR